MQGLFDAPGWNLGTIAKEAPTKLSKSQQKKAFKRKKLVEVALGQAAPRKPKVQAEVPEHDSKLTTDANKNGSKEISKRKAEADQQNTASNSSPKKQKFDNKRNDAKATNDKSFVKKARESVQQNDINPSTKDHMEVDSKLSMGQGTNRSNYVSVLSADPQDAYIPQSTIAHEELKPVAKQIAKPVNKKAKNNSEADTQKSTEAQASANDVNATEEQSSPVLSKAQRKRLARQQRQQAKDEAKPDDPANDAVTETKEPTKPKPTVPTKKVDDKQKKKLQAVSIKYQRFFSLIVCLIRYPLLGFGKIVVFKNRKQPSK